MFDTHSVPPEFLRSFSPRQMAQLFCCGATKAKEIIKRGEVVSYIDGRNRRITGESIYRRIQRLLKEEAARTGHQPIAPQSLGAVVQTRKEQPAGPTVSRENPASSAGGSTTSPSAAKRRIAPCK
jgi:hypothetical protein